MIPKLDPEIKQKWLFALRDPNNKQTTGSLRRPFGGMCCLGVLCEVHRTIVNPPVGWIHKSRADHSMSYDGHSALPPEEVIRWAENEDNAEPMNDDPMVAINMMPEAIREKVLAAELPEWPTDRAHRINRTICLSTLNDDVRLTFAEIADVIEACL